MKITKKKNLSPYVIIASVIGVVAAGSITYALVSHAQTSNHTSTISANTASSNSQNTSETTSPAEAAGNTSANTKTNVPDQSNQTPTPTSSVNVVVVGAGQYDGAVEVRAYANGTVESGTCTFTFTKGGSSFTKQTTATPSASTSACGTLSIPASTFPSTGTWAVTVAYASSSYTGTSASSEITVQ